MPAIEQYQTRDQIKHSEHASGSSLQSVRQDAWGKQTKGELNSLSSESDTLKHFGNLTIDSSSEKDALRSWCAKPFHELQPPTGLKAAEKQVEQSKGTADDCLLGFQVGTVKAVYSVGNSLIGMANAVVSPPAEFGNWLASTLKEPATAIRDSGNLGTDVGKNIAHGVEAAHRAEAYIQSVKHAEAHGDYTKPFKDINTEVHKAADKFSKLNAAEQTKIATEQLVSFEIQVATGKVLTDAPKAFASLLEKMDEFKVKADAHRLHFGVEQISRKNHADSSLAQRELENLAAQPDHYAGAKNSRFGYEEYDKVRRSDIPIQCHDNACVAAAGEILTEGKMDQRSLVQSLELCLDEDQRGKESALSLQHLPRVLGPEWQYVAASTRHGIDEHQLLADLLSRKTPFAVTLKIFEVDAHAVVVDGVSDVGRLIIRDPADGTMYQINMDDFIEKYWTLQAVARRR